MRLTAVSQECDVQVVDDGGEPERVRDHTREEAVMEQYVWNMKKYFIRIAYGTMSLSNSSLSFQLVAIIYCV